MRSSAAFSGNHQGVAVRPITLGKHQHFAGSHWHQLGAKTPVTIPGVIIAEALPFRDGRGQFNRDSLARIVELMKENDRVLGGTRVNLGHDSGIGFHVGRVVKPRLSTTTVDGVTVACARGDLIVSTAASVSPHGDLSSYVAALAEEGADLLMLSLVLRVKATPIRGQADLWMPTEIEGADLVAVGAATSSLLSPERQDRLNLCSMRWTIAKMQMNCK